MSTNQKVLLGVLTFFPIATGLVYLLVVIGVIMKSANLYTSTGFTDALTRSLLNPTILYPGLIAMVVLRLGLTVYYIIHILRSKFGSETEKVLWVLLVIVFADITLPVYFFTKIMRDNRMPA